MPARTAVVTGAAGGLGAAITAALEHRGFEVVATDVRGADHILDVTDAAACRVLAERVRPTVWVNNAGILGDGHAVDQADADITRVIGVNLLGVINGSRAAASVMRGEGGGHILNVGSMASWVAPAGLAVYAATKHGVRAYSVALAAELAGTGVRVSVLCPDGIWTPMLHDRLDTDTSAMSFIAGTLLMPDEVAAAAMRLIDSGNVIASIPRRVGVIARVLCVLPALNIRLTPLMRRLGRRGQLTMARRTPTT
jgi:short-subunit dehydrogenase